MHNENIFINNIKNVKNIKYCLNCLEYKNDKKF